MRKYANREKRTLVLKYDTYDMLRTVKSTLDLRTFDDVVFEMLELARRLYEEKINKKVTFDEFLVKLIDDDETLRRGIK